MPNNNGNDFDNIEFESDDFGISDDEKEKNKVRHSYKNDSMKKVPVPEDRAKKEIENTQIRKQALEQKKLTVQRRRKKKQSIVDKLIRVIATLLRKPVLLIIIAAVIVGAIAAGVISCSLRKPKMSQELITSLHLAPMHPNEESWYADGQFMYYEDNSYTSILGIDVSDNNGDINWKKVKKEGIDFAIIRIGYRGYETGKFKMDENYKKYINGASRAGLFVGVYFVTQAVNEEEAVEEAEYVLSAIEGLDVQMPIYIDCEENAGETSRTDDLTKEQFTANAKAFCERIEQAGYRAGVYSYPLWLNENLDMTELNQFDIWFAKYHTTPYTDTAFNMWQFTSSAEISGIDGVVDVSARIIPKHFDE